MSKHEDLVDMAVKILGDRGFKQSEIHREYKIKTAAMVRGFKVDVVGIKEDLKIAIECGNTPGVKATQLKLFFDEVVLLPYLKKKSEPTVRQERFQRLEEKYALLLRDYERVKKQHHINGLNQRVGNHLNQGVEIQTDVDATNKELPLDVVCGDCKGIRWVNDEYACAFEGSAWSSLLDDQKRGIVEERVPMHCEKFDPAPRELRIRMQNVQEVGITTVYGNGSVQLPKEIRAAWGIKDGDKILWIRKGTSDYTFRKCSLVEKLTHA